MRCVASTATKDVYADIKLCSSAVARISLGLQAGGYLHPMAVAGRSYARVYYPGGTDAVAAVQIDVTPGAVVGGIDLRITTVP